MPKKEPGEDNPMDAGYEERRKRNGRDAVLSLAVPFLYAPDLMPCPAAEDIRRWTEYCPQLI